MIPVDSGREAFIIGMATPVRLDALPPLSIGHRRTTPQTRHRLKVIDAITRGLVA